MCAPAISAVAGIGMSVLQAGASASAANADYAAKVAQWQQNIINSEAAGRDEEKQIIGQQLVQQAKDVQAKHISFIQEAQKKSTVAVNAADAGVSGISVDNLIADIAGKSELNRSYDDENYRNIVADTQMKLTASYDTEKARINSVSAPIPPNPIASVAPVFGAGIKAFGALTQGDIGLSMGDA